MVREAVFDTAYAAKRIRDEKMEDAAAIASKEAAEHFGLQILDEDIHDKERGENIQRYLLLARSAIPSHLTPFPPDSRRHRQSFD